MTEPTLLEAGLGSFLLELADLCRRHAAEIVSGDAVWLKFGDYYLTNLHVTETGDASVCDPFSNEQYSVTVSGDE